MMISSSLHGASLILRVDIRGIQADGDTEQLLNGFVMHIQY